MADKSEPQFAVWKETEPLLADAVTTLGGGGWICFYFHSSSEDTALNPPTTIQTVVLVHFQIRWYALKTDPCSFCNRESSVTIIIQMYFWSPLLKSNKTNVWRVRRGSAFAFMSRWNSQWKIKYQTPIWFMRGWIQYCPDVFIFSLMRRQE